jgi:flagellar hook-associated protein 1 FlgK
VTTVEDINSTLDKIANLNKKIKVIEGSNNLMKANDYRDERNALLDKLSGILPISCYENGLGEVIISLQGKELVNGSNSNTISIENDEKGLANIYWKDSKEKIELNGSGELGGLIDVRDGSIKEYINRLDVLVKTIATEINNIHRTGLDLQGNTNIDFFVPTDGSINASNIRVNPILSDFNKIAASKTLDKKGDGDIAKAIYELREQALYGKFNPSKPFDDPSNKDMNIDEFYNDLIAVLGIERESSRGTAETQAFLINQINEDRKGISSVSLDEEMADMIKYQHSYVANSRVINAVDEMIENVVNRLGLVGR